MPRTTRATRHQLADDGKQVSPLVALDDEPRRRRGANKKKEADAPVVVQEEKITVSTSPKKQKPASSEAPKLKAADAPAANLQKKTSTKADVANARSPKKIPVETDAPAARSPNKKTTETESPVKPRARGRPSKKTAPAVEANDLSMIHVTFPSATSLDSTKHSLHLTANSTPCPTCQFQEPRQDGASNNTEFEPLIDVSPKRERRRYGYGLGPVIYPANSYPRQVLFSEVNPPQKPWINPHREVANYLPSDSEEDDHETPIPRIWNPKSKSKRQLKMERMERNVIRARKLRQVIESARQQRLKAKCFLTFQLESPCFAIATERLLEGTYRIPTLSFVQFMNSLECEDVELIPIVPAGNLADQNVEPTNPNAEVATNLRKTGDNLARERNKSSDENSRPPEGILQASDDPQRPNGTPELASAVRFSNVSPDEAANTENPTQRGEGPQSWNDFPPPPKRKQGNMTHRRSVASKRRKISPHPPMVSTQPLASTGRTKTNAIAKPRTKKYATAGSYDRNGNLILPGQEILGSSDSEDEREQWIENGRVPESPNSSEEDSDEDIVGPPVTPRAVKRQPTLVMTPDRHPFAHLTPQTMKAFASEPVVQLETPRTQKAPQRGWGFGGLTSSLGKLVPFSFFGRSSDATISKLSSDEGKAVAVVAVANEPLLATPSRSNTLIRRPEEPSEDELKELMRAVIQDNCPGVESPEVAASLQALFDEAKSSAREALTVTKVDSNTDKLLAAMKQKYPGFAVTPTSMENHVKSVVAQQKLIHEYRQELANKDHRPIPRHRLDRYNITDPSRKRKFRDTYDMIPNPKGTSYGMDLDYFCDSSDEDDNQENADTDVADADYHSHPQAAKRVKVQAPPSVLKRPIIPPTRKAPISRATELSGPTPYTGNIFHSPGETNNVFHEHFKVQAANAKSPGGVGHFEVPTSDDDSDNSEESGEDQSNEQTISKPNEVRSRKVGRPVYMNPKLTLAKFVAMKAFENSQSGSPNASNQKGKSFTHTPYKGSGKSADSSSTPSGPPPAPTPSHAALPSNSAAGSNGAAANTASQQSSHDPVALARAQANKYAPKTSSKLKSVSRLSGSPAHGSAASRLAHQAQQAQQGEEQAREGEEQTQAEDQARPADSIKWAPSTKHTGDLSLVEPYSFEFEPVIIDWEEGRSHLPHVDGLEDFDIVSEWPHGSLHTGYEGFELSADVSGLYEHLQ